MEISLENLYLDLEAWRVMVLFLKMAYCYRAMFLHWVRCLLTTSFLEKTANKLETMTDKMMSKNKSTIKRLCSIWSTKYKIMSAGTNGWLTQFAFVMCSQPWINKVKNTHAKNPPECPWNWSRWKIFWAMSGLMVKTSQKNIVKIPMKKTAAIEYPEVTPCNFSIGKKTYRKKRITDAPSVSRTHITKVMSAKDESRTINVRANESGTMSLTTIISRNPFTYTSRPNII